MANFDQQSERLFGKVGIGLGKEESYRIQASLKRLAESKKTLRLRFWGKILARSGDYLVVEGVPQKVVETGQAGGEVEKAKEGANYNTYWVSQDLCKLKMTQWGTSGSSCRW